MATWIDEIRGFFGMQKDFSPTNVPANKYIDAENIRLYDKLLPFLGGATLTTGNEYKVNLDYTSVNHYTGYRITFDLSTNAIGHNFNINGSGYGITSGSGSKTDRYNSLVSGLATATLAINGGVYIGAPDLTLDIVHVGFSFDGDWTLIEAISAISVPVQIISEYYADTTTPYIVLKTYNNRDDLYILKTNGEALALDHAIKNETTQNWTNTTVFKTKSIKYATSLRNIIDLDFELDFGEQCSFYISGTPPRAIYVKQSQLGVANSAFIWNENPAYIETGNPFGYYTYENVERQTRLQVLENLATASFVSMQEGGSLSAGNKMYCVRQLIGTTAKSGFNIVSNPINVMSQSLIDLTIHGNTGGYPTSKSITLTINGLNPKLYNKFDLAVIENIDGVLTVKRVNTYDITGTSKTITHYGNEPSTSLTVADIVTQQVVLLSAGNVVINRNRLFLSDITLRQDRDLAAFFDSGKGHVTVTTHRTSIAAIGVPYSSVAEYQLPENVNYGTGYMLNETYRLGTLVIENDGYVNAPYFTQDWTCYYSNSAQLTNDVNSGVLHPTDVYVYHPQVTIDYSSAPTINGQPFLSQVAAICIVRQECIPEVLISGLLMPSVFENDIAFSVGQWAATLDYTNLPKLGPFRARKGAILAPDILFRNQSISFEGGDILKVSDSVYNYNQLQKFPLNAGSNVFLNEFASSAVSMYNAFSDIALSKSEEVPFNSVGNIQMDGKVLSTSVTSFLTGCQQRLISIETTTDMVHSGSFPSAHNGGAFYVQYFRPLTNKYGDKKGGEYVSCGHFETNPATALAMNVYGGDTFTQKNFTKFVNKGDFEIYEIAFDSFVPSFNFTVGDTWTYIIEAHNASGGVICETLPKSITVTAGNNTKSHLITYTNVVGATFYKVFFNVSTAPANWYYYNTTTTEIYYIDVNSNSWTNTSLPANPTTYLLSTGLSYYTQNRNNYQMRYFPIGNNNNYPYTTTDINVWLTPTGGNDLVEGNLNYSQSYTPIAPIKTYTGYDNTLPKQDKLPSTLYYSEIKEDGTPQDPYRIFLPLNYKLYTQYGRITNTFKDVNALIILCEQAVLQQRLDVQQQQTDPNGTDIILGNGTVLGAREIISSYFGSSLKSGAISYITKAGSWFTAWYNEFHDKVFRRGGDGTRDLGGQNYNQTFFSNNNQFIANENDIIFGWDAWSQEVLMRAKAAVPGENIWVASTPYSSGSIVKVGQLIGNGSTVMYRYFKAKINVPNTVGSPLLIANQLNYWEIYRNSNYLIAFCEHDNINDYTSFYGYTCDSFVPYKDTFLTNMVVDNIYVSATSGLFEHNKNTLKYYSMSANYGIQIAGYISLIFNKENSLFKTLKKVWVMAQDLIITDIHFFGGNNRSQTFSIQSDIVEKRPNEGAWWSNVKNDATITGTNTTSANNTLTAKVGGQTNNVIVFFKNTDNTKIGNINRIILSCIPKPRNPFN